MSADRPDDPRNALARALDEASSGAASRAYSVPVDAVRRRAGRRRAARTAGTAAVALVVVAGAGTGVAAGIHGWRSDDLAGTGFGETAPSGGATVSSTADWPGQFAYCGRAAEAAYAPLSSAWLTLDPAATATMPADGEWSAAVTTEVTGAGEDPGWVWGTDLLVVKDGVVVGVQDGAPVPPVEDLDAYLGGAAPSFATAPFPLVSDVSMGLASCDQYPSGEGDPRLAPGTYDLVVAQTVSYLRHSDGARVDLRLATQTTVTITAADGSGAPPTLADVTACGAPVSDLAALADPQLNPMAFPVEADVSGAARVGRPLADTVSLTLDPGWLSDALVIEGATAVLTRDGVVVGDVPRNTAGGTGTATARFLAGVPQDCAARAAATSEPEDGFPLGAGDYELWLVLAAQSTGPDVPDSLAAAGPWPVTLVDHPTSAEPDPAQTATWLAQRDTLFPCGQAPDEAALAVALGLSSAQPRTTPVAISRVDYSGSLAAWSATLTPWDAFGADVASVTVDVLAAPSFAFVGPDGRTAGYTVPNLDGGVQRGVVDDAGLRLASGTDATYLVGCGPDGTATLAYAEEGLPPGAYTAYPMVPVVVTSMVDAPDAATAYSDGSTGAVLLVGPPQSVTFAAR